MYRTSDSSALSHTQNGGSPHRRIARHSLSFDLTVPGLNSEPARNLLAHAFGAGTQAFVVQISRRHDCTTLYVETDRVDINDVIGMLTTHFPNATLGRVTRVVRR
ncbi:hypothetical protein [Caballeronia insecticola]|uniref:Uncharacterized protein n=1 Tax=Caballeronia insecticola TaxID=758793 RepID=R4WZN2_9BURK|nr:hypothetical protein [Caballeronia insecticola]BAN25001.1 putative uncharacterized protein [Caballeronia insecticola]